MYDGPQEVLVVEPPDPFENRELDVSQFLVSCPNPALASARQLHPGNGSDIEFVFFHTPYLLWAEPDGIEAIGETNLFTES